MRPVLRVVVLVATALPIAIALSAQQRPRSIARIFVTVVDEAGAPVLDLAPDAFEVLEAGAKVEVVRASLVTEPMRIALIVDTSDQAKTSLTSIRAGLHAFLDTVPLQDEILLISSGGQARVRLAPTLDRQRLSRAVDDLFAEGGAAVLLDALRESWTRFLRDAKDRWPVFVVVGTDGPDNSSTRNPEFQVFIRDIQNAAANAHVIMLTASSTRSSSGFTSITASLNVTSYTGGRYESLATSTALPSTLKKLGEQIAAQQQRIRTQYEVDYTKQSDDPQARIGVLIQRPVAGIGLSIGRPID